MNKTIAGIDVHKLVLMVVATVPGTDEPQRHRFGATASELTRMLNWLRERSVDEVVMESTAQYWKPVWYALEGHFRLYLAQAWSNRAPRGKKTDFKDAERLVRRHAAGELTLSFVPEASQRQLRSLTRRRTQLSRDRVRIQNQVESLLEETRIKISGMLADLFGASGLRILAALARGQTDAEQLAALADARVQRSPAELVDALTGAMNHMHRRFLQQHLDHLALIDQQIEELTQLTAETLRAHADAVARLAEVPGIRVLSAQQIIAETGADAKAFASASRFTSWIGVCPAGRKARNTIGAAAAPKAIPTCGAPFVRPRRPPFGPTTASSSRNSDGSCPALVIRKRSGRSPAIWQPSYGRSCTTAPGISNTAAQHPPPPQSAACSDSNENSDSLATPMTSSPCNHMPQHHDFQRSGSGAAANSPGQPTG